ncbi:SCO family protein [Profundibacterium mesophilum]|uniref:PrrC n=1 Tax=Profundibacterium mesophilum KAUST100406-0324 TaxID=1037889 RepID=A0A921NSM2_9RHOB|nr:SCO family protein [Profundibacterium mesophilum]KAF0677177.1 PrrC [Profundibacterium mesophilum KAUST100406-0324]
MTDITPARRRLIKALWAGSIIAAILVAALVMPGTGADHGHRVSYTGEADIRSEFRLVDHHGKTVTQGDFAGRWQLVFFGFTQCPDICPTTLAYMGGVLDLLGAEAGRVAPLFVTVDPEHDTPEVLAEYVTAFHPRLLGLTGSEAQIADAAEAFKVYHERLENADAPHGYMMAHAGHIYLMRPDGAFEAVFIEGDQPPEALAEEISMRIAKEASKG